MKTINFNCNEYVYVKLTQFGKEILAKDEEEFRRLYNIEPIYKFKPEDEDGWSKWQLWDLMNIFGPYMKMGCNNPFDLSIKFEV